MLAGVRDVAIITQRKDLAALQALLGDGGRFGMEISYVIQEHPLGSADTIRLSEEFLEGSDFLLALGDNIFFGSGFSGVLKEMAADPMGARILVKQVSDPERFGIAWISPGGAVTKIQEKPSEPSSNFAITGLYFLRANAVDHAKALSPSARGELEVTDLLSHYMSGSDLRAWVLPRGTMWLDTGTIESMMSAAEFVQSFQDLSGQLIGSPEEVAWRNGWISEKELEGASRLFQNSYGAAIQKLIAG